MRKDKEKTKNIKEICREKKAKQESGRGRERKGGELNGRIVHEGVNGRGKWKE